ncbi:hypothetical protein R1flu_012583 [Riccia fluitans]|uniref:Uncharacterized protein n=1 Tax=Riccia fluitans TaxID=41844 RepID=A0ABD1ZB61_9MARC
MMMNLEERLPQHMRLGTPWEKKFKVSIRYTSVPDMYFLCKERRHSAKDCLGKKEADDDDLGPKPMDAKKGTLQKGQDEKQSSPGNVWKEQGFSGGR